MSNQFFNASKQAKRSQFFPRCWHKEREQDFFHMLMYYVFFYRLAIIQLSTWNEVFILDMISLMDNVKDSEMKHFAESFFANPQVLKLGKQFIVFFFDRLNACNIYKIFLPCWPPTNMALVTEEGLFLILNTNWWKGKYLFKLAAMLFAQF